MIRERFEIFVSNLLSRKFVLTVISSTFTAANFILGWGLTEAQIAAILAPVGAFILAEGAADVAARVNGNSLTVSEQREISIPSDSESGVTDEVWTGTARQRTADEKAEDEEV